MRWFLAYITLLHVKYYQPGDVGLYERLAMASGRHGTNAIVAVAPTPYTQNTSI